MLFSVSLFEDGPIYIAIAMFIKYEQSSRCRTWHTESKELGVSQVTKPWILYLWWLSSMYLWYHLEEIISPLWKVSSFVCNEMEKNFIILKVYENSFLRIDQLCHLKVFLRQVTKLANKKTKKLLKMAYEKRRAYWLSKWKV